MSERGELPSLNTLLVFGALAAGAYVLYQLFTRVPNPVLALNQAGAATGSWLYQLLHPTPSSAPPPSGGNIPYPPGSVTVPGVVYYTTTFDNGATHAVDASTVAQDGSFQYQGANYQLVVGAGGNFAISA